MGRLTTHVLDTAAGTPGQNLAIALFKIVDNQRQPIKSVRTNHDGRCDASHHQGAVRTRSDDRLDGVVLRDGGYRGRRK